MTKKKSKPKTAPSTIKTEVESLDDTPTQNQAGASTPSTSNSKKDTSKKETSSSRSTSQTKTTSEKVTPEKLENLPDYTFKKTTNNEKTIKVELDNVIEFEGYFYRGVVMVNEKTAKELDKLDEEKTQRIMDQIRN